MAHHYTEARLVEQAIPYWQQAGQKAIARSANAEAISHLNKGLGLLQTLPDTAERARYELTLQTALGVPLTVTKGYAAPEVERAYARARELYHEVGESPYLSLVLFGLWRVYCVRAEFQRAHELAKEFLTLAHRLQDPALLLEANLVLGATLLYCGEPASAREHVEQSIVFYDPQQHRSLAFRTGQDPGVASLSYAAHALWLLGYPEQAVKRISEALTLARELAHPYSLVWILDLTAHFHQFRREWQDTQERAQAAISLSTEQEFPFWLAYGTILRGWALAEQGQGTEGIEQIRQGMIAFRTTGAELYRPYSLTLLAEAYGKVGQAKEGLNAVSEALTLVNKTGERFYEAELYRLRGELTLAQSSIQCVESSVQREAEACFLKALDIARKQQAKSLELRAVMSLVRLRQQQAAQSVSRTTQHETRIKLDAARTMLSDVYYWFTEGFDTKDLQEAKALLEELT